MFTCPLLDAKSDPIRCTIHASRPKVCRLFPIDERDLRDREIVARGAQCGYSFLPLGETPSPAGRDPAGAFPGEDR
jgi:Fe-S-cluster containining protein